MHILHVFPALHQGGAENQLELLINESFKSTPNVKHSIISLKSDVTPLWKRLESKGVSIYSCNLNSIFDVKAILKLRRMLKEYTGGNNIVHCWMYHANFFTSVAGMYLGLNLVWSIRRTEIPHGITGIISKLLVIINKIYKPYIISNSQSGLISHTDAGYDKKHIRVIPNGFNVILNKKTVPECLKREGIIDENFIFGHVGRYASVKGHRYLFEALLILKDKIPEETYKNVKFIFVGRDVAEEKSLQQYINNPLIKSQCVFVGEQEDVFPFLQRFNCFVLPSLSEGSPNCLVEAMLTSIPCVATNVGDVKMIGEDLILISEPGSAIDLSNNMLNILNKTSIERDKLGNELKKLAEKKYSIYESWSQYFNLYNKILGK